MPISVLICDDLASVQGMLRRMLERDGLVVAGVAGSADEVLSRYRELRPDIVLLDYRMPGADGLSLLRQLRSLDSESRVVMCSGLGDPVVRLEALQVGAVDWIQKPIYPASLVACLRALVDDAPTPAEGSSVRHSA